jgi:hypothetical protein
LEDFVLRLFVPILFASALVCHGAEKESAAAGRWEGSAQLPGTQLRLIVDLSKDNGKDWVGSIIIPGLSVKGAPLADIAVSDSEVVFTIKDALGTEATGKAKLKARLTENASLTGDFTQSGNTAPFVLKKTGPPQVDLPPRSTPVSKQLEGEWQGEYEMLGYARHVTIKFTNRGTEGAAVEFVIVGKRTNNVPVNLVSQEGDLITLKSDEFRITYEGRFESETGEIKGTFVQGPFELPLVMRRARNTST